MATDAWPDGSGQGKDNSHGRNGDGQDRMGLSAERIAEGMDWLCTVDQRFRAARDRLGPPAPRLRPRGYETLLRAIVSQQVSTAAAASIWRRMEESLGPLDDPRHLLGFGPDVLRAAGLSRQKADYCLTLAAHVADGSLPLDALAEDDEAAIRCITAVRGLGRWTAEIYLLFAEGRPDVFPAGDLAVQVEAGRLFQDGARPTERQLRALAEAWRPHRGTAALFLWHSYNAPPL